MGILCGSASTKSPVVTGLPAFRGVDHVSHRQGRRRLPEPRGRASSPYKLPYDLHHSGCHRWLVQQYNSISTELLRSTD